MTPHPATDSPGTTHSRAEHSATTAWFLVIDADGSTHADRCGSLPLDGGGPAEARDGDNAVPSAPTEPPTLVITELRLPLVDGYALCEILRRDGTIADVLMFRL